MNGHEPIGSLDSGQRAFILSTFGKDTDTNAFDTHTHIYLYTHK